MDGRKQWEVVEILGTRGIDIVSGLPLYVHRKCSWLAMRYADLLIILFIIFRLSRSTNEYI